MKNQKIRKIRVCVIHSQFNFVKFSIVSYTFFEAWKWHNTYIICFLMQFKNIRKYTDSLYGRTGSYRLGRENQFYLYHLQIRTIHQIKSRVRFCEIWRIFLDKCFIFKLRNKHEELLNWINFEITIDIYDRLICCQIQY